MLNKVIILFELAIETLGNIYYVGNAQFVDNTL